MLLLISYHSLFIPGPEVHCIIFLLMLGSGASINMFCYRFINK